MTKKIYCKDCKYYDPRTNPLYYAYYTDGIHFPSDCSEPHGIQVDTPIEKVTYYQTCIKNRNNNCKYFKKHLEKRIEKLENKLKEAK